MSNKIVSFQDHQSKRVKKKTLVIGKQDFGEFYAENFVLEFDNILNHQSKKKEDEPPKNGKYSITTINPTNEEV